MLVKKIQVSITRKYMQFCEKIYAYYEKIYAPITRKYMQKSGIARKYCTSTFL